MAWPQPLTRHHQVRQREQAEQLRRVSDQPSVADLAMPEQVLDDMERVLDPRTNLRLGPLGRDHQLFQRALRHRLDLAALKRHVPPYRLALHLIALVYAGIACVTKHLLLMTMQQRVRLRDIRLIGRRRNHAVHQTRLGVDANVG